MSDSSATIEPTLRTKLLVWWVIWASLLIGLCVIWWQFAFLQPDRPLVAVEKGPINFVGLMPLLASAMIRWFVLPRFSDGQKAFVVFVLGIAMAEACGIMGIFLGGPYRDELFVVGLLGMIQYVPFYARRYYAPAETATVAQGR